MTALARNGRNATVRGCSSMAEQKLPKLRISTQTLATPSKTHTKTVVLNQPDNFWRQNKIGPGKRANADRALTANALEVRRGF